MAKSSHSLSRSRADRQNQDEIERKSQVNNEKPACWRRLIDARNGKTDARIGKREARIVKTDARIQKREARIGNPGVNIVKREARIGSTGFPFHVTGVSFGITGGRKEFPAKAQRRKESTQNTALLNIFAPLRLCGKLAFSSPCMKLGRQKSLLTAFGELLFNQKCWLSFLIFRNDRAALIFSSLVIAR
jgi:hypothetical protein